MTHIAELTDYLAAAGLLSPIEASTQSIVDVAGTLARWLGGESDSDVPELSRRVSAARGIVFIVADGLGVEQLDRTVPDGFLRGAMGGELRSVFPSTTATALTSLASATWAGVHGVTGWWTHLPALSRTLCALTYSERGTGVRADHLGVGMSDIVATRSLYRTERADILSLLPQHLAESPYARWTRSSTRILSYRTPGHAMRKAARLARRQEGRFLLSVYLPHVDAAIHRWGTEHAETTAVIGELDRGASRLADTLPPDVTFCLTADHGLIDLDRKLHTVLEDGDPVLETLQVPPTGEGTAPFFHVREGQEQRLRNALDRSAAGSAFRLVPVDHMAHAGFFGPDGIDPRVRGRFGTHIGIAREPALLEYIAAGHRSIRHRGIHGGLRPGEMRVPLSVAGR